MLTEAFHTNPEFQVSLQKVWSVPPSGAQLTPALRSRAGAFAKETNEVPGRREHQNNARSDPLSPPIMCQQSILCVEGDGETAKRLVKGLEDFGYSVELALDGGVGLARVHASRPDLVLCDVSAPRMIGLHLLKELSKVRKQHVALPFVAMVGHGERDCELTARRLGADDCLSKPVDLEILGVVIGNRLRHLARLSPTPGQFYLTHRERDVLTWVSRGKTSAEIAIILGLRERTVNFHCENAAKRLDVVSRTQAVATAISQGLISM